MSVLSSAVFVAVFVSWIIGTVSERMRYCRCADCRYIRRRL